MIPFSDGVPATGIGWPDTYPNQAPLLRIDHLWSNARLVPLRTRAVRTKHSDHRMVVCDYLMR